MDERHAYWLAALVDGEGSIIVRDRPDRPRRVVIVVSQNDRRLLDRAVEYLGCGRIYAGLGPRKNGHQLQINRQDDVHRVLTSIAPLLVLKSDKAEVGLAIIEAAEARLPQPRVGGRFAARATFR